MLDLALLKVMRDRAKYYQLRGRVPEAALDEQTRNLLKDFGAYFEKFPKADEINVQDFLPIFRTRHPNLTPEKATAYEAVIKALRKPLEADKADGVMNSMLELRLTHELAQAVESWHEGELPQPHARFRELIDGFEQDANVETMDYVRIDIDALLEATDEDVGVQWRLECLRRSMRAMRGGDFGIIAGRPDQGKTTFLASELTHIASQLPADRPVVWLNNEGPGDRIYLRLIQAALGETPGWLREKKDQGVSITDLYAEVVGDPYKIRVFDIHGKDTYAVENMIRKNKPGVVVYDMIDKVQGFGDAARTDLGLERMYDWARELCVKYDCVGLATSQISVEGDQVRYPPMSALKDSKTGKQGACDFIVMIGSVDDPGLLNQRFIGIPKNKLRREGEKGNPKEPVLFKPEYARFADIPIETTES